MKFKLMIILGLYLSPLDLRTGANSTFDASGPKDIGNESKLKISKELNRAVLRHCSGRKVIAENIDQI